MDYIFYFILRLALSRMHIYIYIYSDYGCCIHIDATIFVVLLGDTDSTSMLSYLQRHYGI